MKILTYLLILALELSIFLSYTSSKSVVRQPNTKKSKSAAAIPRSKQSKSNSLFGILNQGILQRVVREVKSSFSSDLESLTLQLTKPMDTSINLKILEELITTIDAEYDNPEFLVSLFAKLSRKLSEPSIYTKLKVLLSLHTISNHLSDKVKLSVLQCVKSLRREHDGKVGMEFFSMDSIEIFATLASTVGELETLEFSRIYGKYLFHYLDLSISFIINTNKLSKKSKVTDLPPDNVELADGLLNLLDQINTIEDMGSKSSSILPKICLDQIKKDKVWIVKHLSKTYEDGIQDTEIKSQVESVLSTLDSKFKSSPASTLASTSSTVIGKVEVETERNGKNLNGEENEMNRNVARGNPFKITPIKKKNRKRVKESATKIDQKKKKVK